MNKEQYIKETIAILHNISEITYERAIRIRDILDGFSVGDTVKIREDLEIDGVYGDNTLEDEMYPFVGKKAKIIGYYLDDDTDFPCNIGGYYLDIGDTSFTWTREMFEKE